jgi:ketosteroid isomerase-like protein
MASANLDLVRSIYANWERGDFSSADWAHPDIDLVLAGGPDPGSFTGLAQMAEAWRKWLSAWDAYHVAAEELRELDEERVLALISLSGRGRTSGVDLDEMRAKSVNLWHLRDGKVIRLVAYADREQALADLGLAADGGAPRS